MCKCYITDYATKGYRYKGSRIGENAVSVCERRSSGLYALDEV